MKEMIPEEQNVKYVELVEPMKRFEKIIGEEVLFDAYMEGNVEDLNKNINKYMGNGWFDGFCQKMDKLYEVTYINKDKNGLNIEEYIESRKELNRLLDDLKKEYPTEMGKTELSVDDSKTEQK